MCMRDNCKQMRNEGDGILKYWWEAQGVCKEQQSFHYRVATRFVIDCRCWVLLWPPLLPALLPWPPPATTTDSHPHHHCIYICFALLHILWYIRIWIIFRSPLSIRSRTLIENEYKQIRHYLYIIVMFETLGKRQSISFNRFWVHGRWFGTCNASISPGALLLKVLMIIWYAILRNRNEYGF